MPSRLFTLLAAIGLQLQVANLVSAEPPADPIEQELLELGEEYQRLNDEWISRVRKRPPEYSNEQYTDAEWRNRPALAGPSPAETMTPKFLDFAKRHPRAPYALDAICFIVRRRASSVDPRGSTAEAAGQAIRLAASEQLNDPRLPALLELVGGQLVSPDSEALLVEAATEAELPATRACALRSLARYRHNFSQQQRLADELSTKPRLTDYERSLEVWLVPYLKSLPFDDAAVHADARRYLSDVERDYRDVPVTQFHYTGPGTVLIQADTAAAPQTNGALAAHQRFAMEHLESGGVSPDITGRDAEGVEFCLSDYRGKVVLLTFSANWCRPCKKLYPLQRELVEKYKDQPFVMLSVNMDRQVETLRASLKSGEITWRCWWDGEDGPIRKSWQSPAAGQLVLLDADGVIQGTRLPGATSIAEFEYSIERAMAKTRPAK